MRRTRRCVRWRGKGWRGQGLGKWDEKDKEKGAWNMLSTQGWV